MGDVEDVTRRRPGFGLRTAENASNFQLRIGQFAARLARGAGFGMPVYMSMTMKD